MCQYMEIFCNIENNDLDVSHPYMATDVINDVSSMLFLVVSSVSQEGLGGSNDLVGKLNQKV